MHVDGDGRYRFNLVVLLASGVLYFSVAGMMLPVLPRFILDELGGGPVALGATFGTYSLGALIVRPFTGRLGDLVGRRRMVVVAGVLFGSSILLYQPAGELGGPWFVVLARLATGMTGSAIYVGQATIATEIAPEERQGEAYGFYAVAVWVGLVVGPPIGEILYQQSGLGAAFGAATAAGIVAGLLAMALPETRPSEGAPARTALVHRAALRPGVVSLLALTSMIGFNAFITPYAATLGVESVRWVFVTQAAVTVSGRIAGTFLLDRVPRQTLGTFAMASAASGTAVLALWPSVAALYVGAVLLAMGLAFVVPLLLLVAIDRAPARERSSVVATLTAFGDIANGAGAGLLGGIVAVSGHRTMFAVTAAASFASVWVFRSGYRER